ncbi:MAG: 5-formyltetrahydrofolate cyclo-ligase [Moritella sp.]
MDANLNLRVQDDTCSRTLGPSSFCRFRILPMPKFSQSNAGILTEKEADIGHQARNKIRNEIRQRRRQLSAEQQQQAATDLVKQFQQHQVIFQATHIALYLHNDGELNTQAVINWCWQQGKQVYIPILHPFSHKHLLFTRLTPDTPLIKNKYGIDEPKLDVSQVMPYLQLDIVCSPLVAFDQDGNRLGMGGGYYDRTIAQQNFIRPGGSAPSIIGLAHDCQQHHSLPHAPWDMPLTAIITPSKSVIFSSAQCRIPPPPN